jgi:hypothetical protein
LIFNLGHFQPGAEGAPPIIGATCAFDAKFYKIVDGIFSVNAYWEGNKKFLQISDFIFQLPALLIDFLQMFCLA